MGILRIQGNANSSKVAGTTLAVSLGSPPATGNCLLAYVLAYDNGGGTIYNVSSISSLNATWGPSALATISKTGFDGASSAIQMEVWAATNIGPSAGSTITATFNNSIPFKFMIIEEIHGLSLTQGGLLDVTASNYQTTANPLDTTLSSTINQANEYLVNVWAYNTNTSTNSVLTLNSVNNGYTIGPTTSVLYPSTNPANHAGLVSAYQVVSDLQQAGGQGTPNVTANYSLGWALSFKGQATPPRRRYYISVI